MRGVNKVIIIGTLGADPEIKQLNNGGIVANISVATSETWNDKQTGERKEHTEWHRVSLFNSGNYKMAEIAQQYLRKGSQVYLEGSLRTRKYQDQQTGQDRYITEIRVESMQMLGSSNRSSGQPTYNNNGGYPNTYPQQNTYQQNPNPYGGMNQQQTMGYQQPPAQPYPNHNPYGQMNNGQQFNNPQPNYQQQPMDNPYINQNQAVQQPMQPPVTQTPMNTAPQPQMQAQPQPQQPSVAPMQPQAQAPQQPPVANMNGTPKAGTVDDDIPF